jgi:hypothetical protein
MKFADARTKTARVPVPLGEVSCHPGHRHPTAQGDREQDAEDRAGVLVKANAHDTEDGRKDSCELKPRIRQGVCCSGIGYR